MLVVLPLLTAFATIVIPACDAVSHGPYSVWYNSKCQHLADQAKLVGGPERRIIEVLGRPTSFYSREVAGERTYNYAPFPRFPVAKFQVHCVNGIVVGLEQFDD